MRVDDVAGSGPGRYWGLGFRLNPKPATSQDGTHFCKRGLLMCVDDVAGSICLSLGGGAPGARRAGAYTRPLIGST